MRRAWGFAALALIGLGIGCASVETRGRVVYDTHCVMCHGETARGDGYFAGQLLFLPPDLTRLAQENGGAFPETRVRLAITGEGREPHFSGAMPNFADLDMSRLAMESQLESVVAYLASIQE